MLAGPQEEQNFSRKSWELVLGGGEGTVVPKPSVVKDQLPPPHLLKASAFAKHSRNFTAVLRCV